MQRDTYTVDAAGKSLGRLATDIATHLIGKHKPSYQPHIDGGDIVEVENADQIVVTGKKLDQVSYFNHSGYPGGIRERNMGKLFAQDPGSVLKLSVSRMLPKTKHRSERMKRLIIK
jgi:large subunit ribosomal protein L13